MTELDIIKAKKSYLELKKEQSILISKKEELEKLKKSPDVIRYLELLECSDTKIPTDDEIISISFALYGSCTNEDKKIYLYQGSYNSRKIVSLELIPISKINTTEHLFNIYINIETGREKYIPKNKIKEFEEENNVIYILPNENSETESQYKEIYNKTRRQYFESLVTTTQEDAIKKVKTLSQKKSIY